MQVWKREEDVVAVVAQQTSLERELLVALVVGDQPLGLVDTAEPHRQPWRTGGDERELVEPARRDVRVGVIRR
jgi:hypothetical protein